MTKHTLLAGSGPTMRVYGYGAAQESNLPSVGLRRRTGFEDSYKLADLQGVSY
jgi:hypothetical protein